MIIKIFSNIYVAPSVGPFIFYYCEQVLFTLRVPSLPATSNDVSLDIVDDEGSI